MAYWESYLEGLGCLGTTLLVELGGGGGGGLRNLSKADGLVMLVDDVNEVSPLVREVLGLEAGGADGRS